jgi:predicted alternative tryptophan synthase beta-subunit
VAVGGGSNFCGSSYVFLSSLSKSRGVMEVFFNPPSPLRGTIGDKRYFCGSGATSSYSLGLSYVIKRVD